MTLLCYVDFLPVDNKHDATTSIQKLLTVKQSITGLIVVAHDNSHSIIVFIQMLLNVLFYNSLNFLHTQTNGLFQETAALML